MIDFQRSVTDDQITIVKVQGWLEDTVRPYFFACMEDLIDDGHREIIVDCSGLGLISSSCLGSLIRASKKINRHGGTIVLANVNSTILDMIRFTGLERIFGVYTSLDSAITKIRS